MLNLHVTDSFLLSIFLAIPITQTTSAGSRKEDKYHPNLVYKEL